MKCPNCGAEESGSFCSFCGSELPKQSVTIINNYYSNATTSNSSKDLGQRSLTPAWGVACPNCKSSNIHYERETSCCIHKTIGLCKDCGKTWTRSCDIPASSQNRIVALLLCIFFGLFGAHQFYAGKIGMGILYIFTMGLFGIGWIIDLVKLIDGSFTDVYGYPLE